MALTTSLETGPFSSIYLCPIWMNDAKLVGIWAQTCEFQNSFNLGTNPLNVDPRDNQTHVEQVGDAQSKALGLHWTISSARTCNPPAVWMLWVRSTPWISDLQNLTITTTSQKLCHLVKTCPWTQRPFDSPGFVFSMSKTIQSYEEPFKWLDAVQPSFVLTSYSFSTFLLLLLWSRWELKHTPKSFDPPMSVISFWPSYESRKTLTSSPVSRNHLWWHEIGQRPPCNRIFPLWPRGHEQAEGT